MTHRLETLRMTIYVHNYSFDGVESVRPSMDTRPTEILTGPAFSPI